MKVMDWRGVHISGGLRARPARPLSVRVRRGAIEAGRTAVIVLGQSIVVLAAAAAFFVALIWALENLW